MQFWYFDHEIRVKEFLGTAAEIAATKDGLAETIAEIKDAIFNNSFERYHKKHQGCQFENY
ncbi:MAG: hypothetical protein HY397_01980 [Candidatus Doudnabacteria bacterium]|nr:hypothetical protein [Candidatus Doudnabacteria bacterium]